MTDATEHPPDDMTTDTERLEWLAAHGLDLRCALGGRWYVGGVACGEHPIAYSNHPRQAIDIAWSERGAEVRMTRHLQFEPGVVIATAMHDYVVAVYGREPTVAELDSIYRSWESEVERIFE